MKVYKDSSRVFRPRRLRTVAPDDEDLECNRITCAVLAILLVLAGSFVGVLYAYHELRN